MCLTDTEISVLGALYDYNRIPLWIYDGSFLPQDCFFSGIPRQIQQKLSPCMERLLAGSASPDFDILCYEDELYYVFSFEHGGKKYYLLGGPMLLTGFVHITEMRSLSFAECVDSAELKLLVENLPVVTLNTFSSCLRVMMMFLKREAPGLDEISSYKFSNLQSTLNRTFTHELFENMEDYRLHTPYREEVAILNCVKEGDSAQLEATYRTLPQTKYGNMSKNPLRLFFYGCIANTTLVTRYAIEGGMEEETAFTLSDVYIQKMENCRTFYELNLLNEKMAVDFTERVAEAKKSKQTYIKPISECIRYISRNLSSKITLADLAKEVRLSPKYLSYLFRKETGQTVSCYIEEKRIEKAKSLLAYSQCSYSEISDSLAFYSQSYFIFAFKKKVGVTPKEYRNRFSGLK